MQKWEDKIYRWMWSNEWQTEPNEPPENYYYTKKLVLLTTGEPFFLYRGMMRHRYVPTHEGGKLYK